MAFHWVFMGFMIGLAVFFVILSSKSDFNGGSKEIYAVSRESWTW